MNDDHTAPSCDDDDKGFLFAVVLIIITLLALNHCAPLPQPASTQVNVHDNTVINVR